VLGPENVEGRKERVRVNEWKQKAVKGERER